MTSDERLLAGRHHLDNGIRALRTGFLDESRSHFEAALLQFRGPELRLGEAHALRGLAEVELHGGRLEPAEAAIRRALSEYAELRSQLDRIDRERSSSDLRRDAEEGEAAGHVLLGEVLLRAGRAEEARVALGYARELYSGLGDDVASAAGLWLTLARLGMRESRHQDARVAAERAVDILARAHDAPGLASAWLLLGEIERWSHRFEPAAAALAEATRFAEQAGQPALQGRAASQRAALLAQQDRLPEAEAAYTEAIVRIREAGDAEMEAFALLGRGDVRSRRQDPSALTDLVVGTRLLGLLVHQHGLGLGMLRLSEHALRHGLPAYALLAAESARQIWQLSDPIHGVGLAYRIEVKALAALRLWPAVVTVAHARAELAGSAQPHALEVRDFYRRAAPSSMLADLDLLDAEQLQSRAESMIEAILAPTLDTLDVDFQSLGTSAGALAIAGAIGKSTPEPALVPSGSAALQALEEATPFDDLASLRETPLPPEYRGTYDEPKGGGPP